MKHLIKIESTPHGVLGVRHAGRDQQYCEAGEQVILKWQPDAKWGLQEAHYTDGNGNVTAINLTPVKIDGKDVVVFTMPNANITVGGTFKMFVSQDWTEGTNPSKGEVLTVGNNGEPTPIPVDELANEIAEGENDLVDAIDRINPFKGWYTDLASLQNNHPSPQVGDYAYVKGAESTDPAAIYECTTAGSWSDSGRTADTSNVQTFASSQEVNEVHIVNDLTTGGVNDILSAEQGKVLYDNFKSTDQQLNGTAIQFVPTWQRQGYYLNPSGTPTASSTWNVSSPFVLKKDQTIEVKTQGSGACIIAATSDGTTYSPLVNAPSGVSGLNTYKYTATEDTTIALSVKWGLGDVVMSTMMMDVRTTVYDMSKAFKTIGQSESVTTSVSVSSGSRLNKAISLAEYVGQIAKVKVTKTGGSTTEYRILYGSSTLGAAFNYGEEYQFIITQVLSSIIFYGSSNESVDADFSITIELSPNYGIEDIDKKMFFDDVDFSGQILTGKYINTNNSTKGSPADLEGAACATGQINSGDILMVAGTGPTQYVGLFAFYDANGQKILSSSVASADKDNPTQIFAPNGAASFVYNTSPYSADTTVVLVRKVFVMDDLKDKVYVIDDEVDALSSVARLNGKTVVCFGDSMTEFTDPNGKRYSDHFADITGANVINVGIGGTRISCRANPVASPTNSLEGYAAMDIPSLIDAIAANDFSIVDAGAAWVRDNASDDNTPIVARLKAVDWTNVDAVTFFAGTNDWGGEANIGTSGEVNIRTVYGAINYIISTLLTAYPKIKIYWFTPIVRWYLPWTDENWGGTIQKAGRTLEQFVELVRTEVEKQCIPVCDMYHTLGWNKFNFEQYFYDTDGTHPTKGYYNIGRKIASFILSNRTF